MGIKEYILSSALGLIGSVGISYYISRNTKIIDGYEVSTILPWKTEISRDNILWVDNGNNGTLDGKYHQEWFTNHGTFIPSPARFLEEIPIIDEDRELVRGLLAKLR